MQTQIAFTTDKKLKAKVMQKVKKEGMTLKGILNQLMQAYTDDQFGMSLVSKKRQFPEERMTEREKKAYNQAMKDFKEGKDFVDGKTFLEDLLRKR